MSDQSMLGLGKIITSPQSRDAIHVAIAPVEAAETLHPGNHVKLTDGKAVLCDPQDSIGITDPFLLSPAKAGHKFWLFLKPGTITSLRHHWTHPAMDESKQKSPGEASKEWLENMAAKCGVTYDRMMDAVENDDYIHMGENETYKDLLEGDQYEEFQKHCSVVLGKPVTGAYPFSCSC